MASTTYEFGRRTNTCAVSGRQLQPGEEYVAALVESAGAEAGGNEDGLQRLDFSREAWESSPRPRGLFAFWRGRVATEEAKKHRLIDDASLLELFEQLADASEPRRVAFRYVLALILVRKRVLVHAGARETKGDSPAVMILSERATGPGSQERQSSMPKIEVIDPSLDAESLRDVTEQLESVLREGA